MISEIRQYETTLSPGHYFKTRLSAFRTEVIMRYADVSRAMEIALREASASKETESIIIVHDAIQEQRIMLDSIMTLILSYEPSEEIANDVE